MKCITAMQLQWSQENWDPRHGLVLQWNSRSRIEASVKVWNPGGTMVKDPEQCSIISPVLSRVPSNMLHDKGSMDPSGCRMDIIIIEYGRQPPSGSQLGSRQLRAENEPDVLCLSKWSLVIRRTRQYKAVRDNLKQIGSAEGFRSAANDNGVARRNLVSLSIERSLSGDYLKQSNRIRGKIK